MALIYKIHQFSMCSVYPHDHRPYLLELGSHASLRDATDEINILLVGMLHKYIGSVVT